MKSADNSFDKHRGAGSIDSVYRYFELGLAVPTQDREKLLDQGSLHYVVYKMYSKGNSVLVTHLTTECAAHGMQFTDRSLIRNPFGDASAKVAEFEHKGMVFHKKTTVYFLSAGSSNLRLMSVPALDFFGFGMASGLMLGTNTEMPYAARIHIKKVPESTANRLKGHYLTTDSRVKSEVKPIDNSVSNKFVLTPYEAGLER